MRNSLLSSLIVLLAGCNAAPGFVETGHSPVIADPGAGEIRSSTQIVYLDFTPESDEAFSRFGLTAQAALRAAIRAHLRAALATFDFAILTSADELAGIDPARVTTIEIRDISDGGLLAADNTIGKDVGNKSRNDYFGGFNDALAADGQIGEGGVFVGTIFQTFTSGYASSQRFREIFAPVAPELGGHPTVFPGSANDAKVGQIVSVLGATIAASAAGLILRAVGLPLGGNDRFHNDGDAGCFLDYGSDRTFEERANIDGKSERLCAGEAEYLRSISL